ncbi:N-6 DNA methylase [Anaerolineales bacterium HSG6]|nr:N-6 DNA methylase [Anaerolineales bacterium HSG6]
MTNTMTLAEGQIYDVISNKPVKETPAEHTLQTVARSLVDEYGFDGTQLVRNQKLTYEFYNEQGKRVKKRAKASIAVFPEKSKHDDSDQIVRVCVVQTPNTKAKDGKRGLTLLEDIMAGLPNCDYGLWTNGTDLLFKQKVTEGRLEPEFVDLYDLPGNNATATDLDKPDYQAGRIATGDNLQQTFARVHDYIYGNQGLKKDAAFWQVLNLIFCKIHDERTAGERRFWVRGTERNSPIGQAAIAERIKSLFEEVKGIDRYATVFSDQDNISLNNRVLAYVVGELSRYNLLETDVDAKGAAYEEITASTLKSQRGQFFTPTNVIRLMVEMMNPGGQADLLNPDNWPRMLDPTCGSGRFLTYALDHVRRKMAAQLYPDVHPLLHLHELEQNDDHQALIREFAQQALYGIDFDPDLKRAARMNMILNNDGHANIFSFNSLEFPLMLDGATAGKLRRQYKESNQLDWPDPARVKVEADLGSFDFVFTNPPFGAKIPIDDPQILAQFELAHRWKKDDEGRYYMDGRLQSRMAPEVLFVERCVQWVKPGTGKIAIVLPDGILGNPDAEYIRYWILQQCQLLASVDLPVEAFLPQVGVQASLLFLRRKSQQEQDAEALGQRFEYPVFMAIAEMVGHDRRGNTVYQRDADGAEISFTVTKDILRRRDNKLQVATVTQQEKQIDDDLPRIAQAYRQFEQNPNQSSEVSKTSELSRQVTP